MGDFVKEYGNMLLDIEYHCLPGVYAAVNQDLLSKCADLYSNHYGKWGEKGVRPNENIRLSEERISDWLESEDVSIYYATDQSELIGYAIALSRKENNYGTVTWVTQLVVHKDYRQNGIAKNILFSIWGFSNHFAWGIVSANPYAVRALEKATRRRAMPVRIKKNAVKLRNIGRKNVLFINDDTVFRITHDSSTVNTEFFVDHSDTEQMLRNVTNHDIPWCLGKIEDGWEWFAFTFRDQEQISLSNEEIENMIATSDSVVRQAYARMDLDETKQKWMRHTSAEIDYVIEKTGLCARDFVYDLGCGTGRHSIELSKRDIEVTGIDYITGNVKEANRVIQEKALEGIQIYEEDCRSYRSDKKAAVVLCLYDVVGSFAIDHENERIINTAYQLLAQNGFAVFTVMNYESTAANAVNTFTFDEEADRLLELPASNIMEESGNVFQSEYYMVDTKSHLVYRKEQFSKGFQLPVELIVRDRRFTMQEITAMCKKVGFTIVEEKYVNASDWRKEYTATDPRAKEILVICQKV